MIVKVWGFGSEPADKFVREGIRDAGKQRGLEWLLPSSPFALPVAGQFIQQGVGGCRSEAKTL